MQKAIFGITAKVDDGSVFGVLLAEDKKTVISPCFSLTAEKFKAFSKDNLVIERGGEK